ncbi:MAG TPA: endolytic transglycosylase MltG [Ktedonobacteraceae bacterium]|jgi:UPF0755 protein|nr:endolytic transglycosylase MltG [Ktedonobacteraceae bacterium]
MKRRSGSRAAIISVLLLGILIFGGAYYAWNTVVAIFEPVSPTGAGKTIPVEISQGESTSQIADDLQRKGLIRNALAFRIWARIKGLDTRLQAGVYKQLNTSMSISQIIDQLLNAQPDAIVVVIPEGWRIAQMAQRFGNAGLIKFNEQDFLRYTAHPDQFPGRNKYPILKLVPAGMSMEGLLFPASYQVPVNATAADVVGMMLQTMQDTIQQNHLDQVAKQHRLSVYQMLILASIVEREAVFPEDRGNIASVYWNRIYRPNAETVSLLDADPTVQYARDSLNPPKPPAPYWAPLNNDPANIAPNSPWNTYVRTGFPPTPICSPGLASMQAAAAPPQTDYYFFLAKKDGHSVFAKTLAEFQADKQKYLQ